MSKPKKRRDGQSILNGLAQLAFGRGNYTVRSEADRICLMRRQT